MNAVCDFTSSLVEWKYYGLFLYRAAKLPQSCLSSSHLTLGHNKSSSSSFALIDESTLEPSSDHDAATALVAIIEQWRCQRKSCSYGLGLSMLRSVVTAQPKAGRTLATASRSQRHRLLTLVPIQISGIAGGKAQPRLVAQRAPTDDDISWLATSKSPQQPHPQQVENNQRRRSSVADTSTATQEQKTRKIVTTTDLRSGKKHQKKKHTNMLNNDKSFATASAERLMAWHDTSMSGSANISFGRGITVEGPDMFLKRQEKGADHLALILGATPTNVDRIGGKDSGVNEEQVVAIEQAMRKGSQILAELSTLLVSQRPSSKK